MPKKTKLDHAISFGHYRYGGMSQISKTADVILDKMNKHQQKYKKQLKLLLCNLLYAYKIDSRVPIAITLNRNEYYGNGEMAKMFLTYDVFNDLIDFLVSKKYIIKFNGFYDKNKDKKFRTRIKSAYKLNILFNKFKESHKFYDVKPPIQLRDNQKRNITGIEIESLKRPVIKINYFLNHHDITLDLSPDEIRRNNYHFIQGSYYGYQRVFNNGSYSQGGRWYSHWSQQVSKEHRKHILIDGQPTVELDYSAFHLHMIYYENDIPMPPGDPYDVGLDTSFRQLIKEAVMILINAVDLKSATRAINKARYNFICKNSIPKDQVPKTNIIIDSILEHHHKLKSLMHNNYGIYLQRIDSDIAEDIMISLMNNDIPSLCIHDSFIVQSKHKQELLNAMNNAFFNVYNDYCPIK